MGIPGIIQGFSRLDRKDQIKLVASFTQEPARIENELNLHLMQNDERQKIYQDLSENMISNFYLPYCIAPNFRINDRYYFLPMVTEESSVIAAASSAAKFWAERGGFRTRIKGMIKPGHVHFTWKGDPAEITSFIHDLKPRFYEVTSFITGNMKSRGGGILGIDLKNLSDKLEGYYQLEVLFNTADAMGANFINSCLEQLSSFLLGQAELAGISDRLTIVMSILSNYTPQCLVECSVDCHPDQLSQSQYGLSGPDFARKFEVAVNMAHTDVYRAVTHNKGIFNGIDAVVMATGNDFRAVEADGHAYAARNGTYQGLTFVEWDRHSFSFRIEMPIALGTVGGITRLHPLARVSMEILGNPDSSGLMSLASAAGLANNFSAIRSLITVGIQKGHMRLHLSNILQQADATPDEKNAAVAFFTDHAISNASVRQFLFNLRNHPRKKRDE